MKRILLSVAVLSSAMIQAQNLNVQLQGRYVDGREDALEIVDYSANAQKIFITNAASDSIDIVDVSSPSAPSLLGHADILSYGAGVNSIAVINNSYFAAAVEADPKQDPGSIVIYDLAGNYITHVTVGALPDMVAVSPDGNTLVVANEGEPSDDYLTDPEGSISIIDISSGAQNITQSDVTTLNFVNAPTTIAGAIQKPGVSWQYDLEPEYISINSTSSIAAVTCQEANVLITVDLVNNSILGYKGLGFKDHSVAGNEIDASNDDNMINISSWPVKGVYQPDAIATFSADGNTYFVTANEGDGRDYSGYSSETRIKDLVLDTVAFPNASILQDDAELGRLKTFTMDVVGDVDNDGDVDELYSYGSRSFSIWDATGNLVWDSGSDFENYISSNHPAFFNCNDGLASKMDSRSDDKGPEPEAITTGEIGDKTYAFIGLERQGGVMIYNVTDVNNPSFETYINSFQGDTVSLDVAPEGIVFVPASESHTGENLLIVSHEVSGTVAIYEISDLTASYDEQSNSPFTIYPNPANNEVFLNNIDGNVKIVDALGKVVYNAEIFGNSRLDVSNWSAGMYYVVSENTSIKFVVR